MFGLHRLKNHKNVLWSAAQRVPLQKWRLAAYMSSSCFLFLPLLLIELTSSLLMFDIKGDGVLTRDDWDENPEVLWPVYTDRNGNWQLDDAPKRNPIFLNVSFSDWFWLPGYCGIDTCEQSCNTHLTTGTPKVRLSCKVKCEGGGWIHHLKMWSDSCLCDV